MTQAVFFIFMGLGVLAELVVPFGPLTRYFDSYITAFGLLGRILLVAVAIYWIVGFASLTACGLDACPEYAGHPLRELSLWILPPVIVAILLTGVFAYPILGAAFSVVAAVIYLIFAPYVKD
jgi:hypothetical protein